MKKFNIFIILASSIISTYFVFFYFQNCAKVNYQTQAGVTVTTTGTGATTEKVVEINPEFFTDPSDMKVLMVVDDSYTMSQSRAQLSNAMDSLLDPLKGRNSEVRIVSTTGVLNNQLDYLSEDEYYDENGPITQAQAQNLANYGVKRNYRPARSARHQPIIFNKNYTDSQFLEVKNNVKQQVQAVGSSGSDSEETLCAALHHLYDKSNTSFFNPGDKVAIIFLTDENDSSMFSSCSKQIVFKSSNRPQIYYSYQQQRVQATVEYIVYNDNVQSTITTQLSIPLKHPNNTQLNTACSEPMSESLRIELNRQGYNVISIDHCIYTTQETFYYGADLGDDGTVPNKDLCGNAAVNYQGRTYSNFYALITALNFGAVSGSCQKTTAQANSLQITAERLPVVPLDSAAGANEDLIAGIQDRSYQLFMSGHIVVSLVRRANDSCELQPGQSVGTIFETLTTKLGPSNAVIDSLCTNSFNTILSNVSQFIVQQAKKSYSLQVLSDNEYIKGINIKRGSNKFTLSSHQYETVGHTFTLLSFDPQEGDIFEVLIGAN